MKNQKGRRVKMNIVGLYEKHVLKKTRSRQNHSELKPIISNEWLL